MRKILRIAIPTAIILGGLLLFYTFRASPDSVRKQKPDFSLSAATLAQEFEENEPEANSRYLDRIIEVKGTVASVEQTSETWVVYLEGTMMSKVACSFSEGEVRQQNPSVGDELTVKGKCSGYILDVVLNKCAIIH